MTPTFKTLSALALASVAAASVAQPADPESRLLAEPMWLLQDADGAAKPVWFERREGKLHLVRCSDSPACRRPAIVSVHGVQVQGLDAAIAVWPDVSPKALSLVPAWVVPASTQRHGH